MQQIATFAAGCFWGVEQRFRQLEGVIDAQVGYTGGNIEQPDYATVCSGRSGHAEAVRIVFDPARISFPDLLAAFWEMHDPTQVDRQGPDVGTQYRSAIFVHDETQRELAEQSRRALVASGRFAGSVATVIEPAETFWPAEEYHQRYLEKTGRVCSI